MRSGTVETQEEREVSNAIVELRGVASRALREANITTRMDRYDRYRRGSQPPEIIDARTRDILLPQIESQCKLLEKLITFKKVVDNFENEPMYFDDLPSEAERNVQEMGRQIVPTAKQFLRIASTVMEQALDADDVAERRALLGWIDRTISKTTESIEDRFESPHLIEAVLDEVALQKENAITKLLLKHPGFSELLGYATIVSAMTMVLQCAVFCTLVGGLPLGLSIFAAGLALFHVGIKICTLAGAPTAFSGDLKDHFPMRKRFFKNQLNKAELADAVENIVQSKKTQSVFTKCKQAVKACCVFRDSFDKNQAPPPYSPPPAGLR